VPSCPNASQDADSHVYREYQELDAWLSMFSEIAGGGTLKQRVERVVIHYATQIGRWQQGRQEHTNV